MSFLSLILVATTIWSDAKEFSFAWAADPFSSNQSYPELASSMLPRALNLSLFLIGDLSPRTLPTGVKPMRISLLRTRELIDLFIFAYPNHDPRSIVGSNHLSLSGLEHHDNDDLLTALRRDLDQGYEALGLFQDLAHAQVEYNERDLKAYRKICLSWNLPSFIILKQEHTSIISPTPHSTRSSSEGSTSALSSGAVAISSPS